MSEKIKFKRQPKQEGGWTIDVEYLRKISKIGRLNKMESEMPSWEGIEAVLLAIEAESEAKSE